MASSLASEEETHNEEDENEVDIVAETDSVHPPPHNRNLLSEEITALDSQHVWHPYAPMIPKSDDDDCNASIDNDVEIKSDSNNKRSINYPVRSAKGCEIKLVDGRVLVDGMSSWWACIHGYNHPVLNDAIEHQLKDMSHIMFGGLTHEPAARLAKELVDITPKGLEHVFFCDSGSVSIEVAMKMAIQYWYNLGLPRKHRFLTVRGGYHGDTFEAMSVCDPVNGMHHMFQSVLVNQIFAPRPEIPFPGTSLCEREKSDIDKEKDNNSIQSVSDLLHQNRDELAAIILEPIVQGAGGMRFYSPGYLRAIRELCDEFGILLVTDEIATGFGRTGKMFAIEHANNDNNNDDDVSPDIMCVGKALSGGYMSFAATLSTSDVATTVSGGGNNNNTAPLMHGPTFMGNPLACAVSLESLRLLQSYDWKSKVRSIESQLKKELAPCLEQRNNNSAPAVKDVRVLGAIGVVELNEPVDMKIAQPMVVEHGVWLRPFGKLLYTMPPFVINPDQLRKITSAMVSLTRRKLR